MIGQKNDGAQHMTTVTENDRKALEDFARKRGLSFHRLYLLAQSMDTNSDSNISALQGLARERNLYPMQIQSLALGLMERERAESGLSQVDREIRAEKSKRVRTGLRILLELREIKALLGKLVRGSGGKK
jgi:hypothetical protein